METLIREPGSIRESAYQAGRIEGAVMLLFERAEEQELPALRRWIGKVRSPIGRCSQWTFRALFEALGEFYQQHNEKKPRPKKKGMMEKWRNLIRGVLT